jgi:CheY-like chemotaxis protein
MFDPIIKKFLRREINYGTLVPQIPLSEARQREQKQGVNLKKILITDDVAPIIANDKSFLDREGVKLLMVATHDDVLSVHRAEKADVIITSLNSPGLRSEELCSALRSENALRKVSVILICPDNATDIGRSAQCKANAVLTMPVDPADLLGKIRGLLDISWRESYRVLVSVIVEGSNKDRPFFGRSGNISTTGILLESEKVLEKGDQLMCSFFLPGSEQIKTNGEIVRVMQSTGGSKTFQYGIRFSQLSVEARLAIEEFVEKKSQVSTSRR